MKIITLGHSQRELFASALLKEKFSFESGTLLLLPIPTTRDGVSVNGTDIPLSSLPEYLSGSAYVVGYGIPRATVRELEGCGALVFDAALDEKFLVENAEITADGALARLITLTKKAPRDTAIGIIGYGRIGSALARRLLFLGVHTVVFSAREAVRISLGEAGVECREYGADGWLLRLDVLVNTAPATLVSHDDMLTIKKSGTLVMDLASGSFLPAGFEVLKLSSVPDALYPETAGRLYAEYAREKLSDTKLI